jgi:hypothetical protein
MAVRGPVDRHCAGCRRDGHRLGSRSASKLAVEVFRVINDLGRYADWPMWVMQKTVMVLALPMGAAIVWFVVSHGHPLVLIGCVIVFGWTEARAINAYLDRGRPGALLKDVSFGWRTPIDGDSYLSGHAVIAVTLAVVLYLYMPGPASAGLLGLGRHRATFTQVHGIPSAVQRRRRAAVSDRIGSTVNLSSGLRRDRTQPEALRIG